VNNVYFDSSVLVSLYIKDANSRRAISLISRSRNPIIFTPLHCIEVLNAIRLATFQGRITPSENSGAQQLIADDIASGVLQRQPIHWSLMLEEALRLSRQHTAEIGCRTLDLLHLATAKLLKVKKFTTFDQRQEKVAKLMDL
jgi:predicted nucleic acid-binding protein